MTAGMLFSRVLLRRGVALCAALALLGLGAVTRVQPAGRTDFEALQIAGPTRVVIPDSFDLPTGGSGLHLTTVVTTDFDSDGDLDVVASDGATHLFVWINDGEGHFTRKAPLPNDDHQLLAAALSVADHPSSALVSIQPGGAVALSNDQRVWISLTGQAFRVRGRAKAASIAPGSLGSRAPPTVPCSV